jgi:hypothetical protein
MSMFSEHWEDAYWALSREVAEARKPRPLSQWHEDIGTVLWWKLPVVEPPYVGSPLDEDFPDYVTCWTPLVLPKE